MPSVSSPMPVMEARTKLSRLFQDLTTEEARKMATTVPADREMLYRAARIDSIEFMQYNARTAIDWRRGKMVLYYDGDQLTGCSFD